jgi:hypothetical protein
MSLTRGSTEKVNFSRHITCKWLSPNGFEFQTAIESEMWPLRLLPPIVFVLEAEVDAPTLNTQNEVLLEDALVVANHALVQAIVRSAKIDESERAIAQVIVPNDFD